MAAGTTYEKIATYTAPSTQTEITFSTISGSYTDIVLVVEGITSNNGDLDIALRFNGDTGNNYSNRQIRGFGTTANSSASSSQSVMRLGVITQERTGLRAHIQNYSNTTTYKTVLSRQDSIDSEYGNWLGIGMWQNTSAITSITIRNQPGQGSFLADTTATIYGITKA